MLDALQPVVMRYLVWSCNTAGVEQIFSVGDRLGVERTPASQIIESLTLRAVFDKLSANERKEVVSRAQELFAEGCPRTRKLSRNSRRGKGAKRFSRTKTSTEVVWLARRRNMVRVAAKLPRTHNLVGAGHVNVGVALPRTHDLVGAGHVGAAELPQGLGQEQRKCLAKQQQKQSATGRGGLPRQLLA